MTNRPELPLHHLSIRVFWGLLPDSWVSLPKVMTERCQLGRA